MKYQIKKELSKSRGIDNVHKFFQMQTIQKNGSDSYMTISLLESNKGNAFVEIEVDGKLHTINPSQFYEISKEIEKLLK